MGSSDHFEEWAATSTLATMVQMRRMGQDRFGEPIAFGESDREAMKDALHVIETGMVQPFGPTCRAREAGGVDWPMYQRAQIQLACAAFQLRDSGLLDLMEVASDDD